jgi:antitoxin component of MazEF toxin-antitoxin module
LTWVFTHEDLQVGAQDRGSLAVVLPEELLLKLKVTQGDSLSAVATGNGFLLLPYNAEVEEQVRHGMELMVKHRDIFSALAKVK